ncbi:hypothetical protein FPE01S_02_05190 [Flavihumibacter petaseus NBRC 106054]|uniref:Uncharacterized protein n=1 Tax=Flavihumibacter petaseus NBRC 106054 TaxID=1220578 RepID=A0A0E9N0Q9_9BACT|nr:hypothetical protein FPE01S_02_05190 [Flavihumibacter petaseus NBRC 106054]
MLSGISACGKDKFETKPTLELKSQSSVVPFDPEIAFSITMKFTDKEGDLSGLRDSSIVYFPVWLNVREPQFPYPVAYSTLPEFPDNKSGEIELRLSQLDYYRDFLQTQPPDVDKNDTIQFKVVVKDKAGNVSDTLTTNPIVLLGQ